MGSNFRTKKLFSKTAKNALIAPFIYIGGQFLIEDQKQSKKKKVKSKMGNGCDLRSNVKWKMEPAEPDNGNHNSTERKQLRKKCLSKDIKETPR